jgi:hypothetical protein
MGDMSSGTWDLGWSIEGCESAVGSDGFSAALFLRRRLNDEKSVIERTPDSANNAQ